MKRVVVFTVFLFAFLLFSLMGQANAATYDLANDFSLASNPNGVWTYGAYSSGLDPTSFFAYSNSETGVLGSLDVWRDNVDPNIVKNTGASDVVAFNITFHAGEVTFGPTEGPSVARWTAPSAGTFQVDASFATVQTINNQPTAYIYVGITPNNLGLVPAFAATIGYSQLLSLNFGDTIDFVVTPNGSTKTTEVSATITQVPEPGTLLLLGSGLLGLALAGSRKKIRK